MFKKKNLFNSTIFASKFQTIAHKIQCFPRNNYYITNRKREIFKSAISINAQYLRIKFSLSLYSIYLYLKKTKSTDNYLLTFTGEVHAKGLCFCAAKLPGDKFHGFLQDPAN